MEPQTNEDFDTRMMRLALECAERGLGTTAPNPAVGAVIVAGGSNDVAGQGWTQPGGRPHAETEAIREAGGRARGGTIYVTLEPCSHQGRTGPCAQAIIDAGLARVVCAILDPDPRVSGRGIRMLRAAGLQVTRGVLAGEAHWVTRGHILRVTERRPFVQLKMALGRDGAVARGTGAAPVWVTGPDARAHGHLMRARTDAIIAGGATVRDDDPELTCRLPGLELQSPIRVVLTGHHLPALTSKLVRSAGDVPVWLFCGQQPDAAALSVLEAQGCRIFRTTELDRRLWLPAVCEALVAEGITRVLVEGGPTVWRAFAASGLVDEILCYRALDGGLAAGAEDAIRDVAALNPAQAFALFEQRDLGPDGLFVFRRK